MEGKTTTLRRYELMLIVSSSNSQKEQEAIFQSVKDTIEEKKGTVEKEVQWGLRDFTYPIKREDHGVYHLIYFHAEANKLSAINKVLVLNPKIYRHITTQIPEGVTVIEEQQIPEEKEEKKARNTKKTSTRKTATKKKKEATDEAPAKKSLKVEVVKATEEKKPAVTAKAKAKSKSEAERLAELDKKLDEILND